MSAPAKLKQKRHVLNFAEKEKVIQKLKLGFTEDKLASDLGASTSTIYKIKKKEDELKKYREENPYSPIRKVFKFSSFPKVDQALKIWFYQQRELNRPITLDYLRSISVEFHENFFPDPTKRPIFLGSVGYIQKFLARNSIKLRNMHGENESCDFVAAEAYKKEFPKIVAGYSMDQIYNADETG